MSLPDPVHGKSYGGHCSRKEQVVKTGHVIWKKDSQMFEQPFESQCVFDKSWQIHTMLI